MQENALTTAVPVKLYDFNQRNLMIQYSESISQTLTKATFIYDGNNDRVAHSAWDGGVQTAETRYTNNTEGLTQVLVSDDGALKTYFLFGNRLIGQQLAGSSQFMTYVVDGLGSVRVEMETSGARYVRTYSPFGETLQESGISDSAYGYTNQQHDDNTSLVYLRARYYNSSLKLFMGRDSHPGSIYHPSSMNGYSYVSNNPINNIDPTGLCQENADEACWGLYEEVLRRHPDSANKRYFHNARWTSLDNLSYGALRHLLRNELDQIDESKYRSNQDVFLEDMIEPLMEGGRFLLAANPYVTGDIIDGYQFMSGNDFVTGGQLTDAERVRMLYFAALPLATGAHSRIIAECIDAARRSTVVELGSGSGKNLTNMVLLQII